MSSKRVYEGTDQSDAKRLKQEFMSNKEESSLVSKQSGPKKNDQETLEESIQPSAEKTKKEYINNNEVEAKKPTNISLFKCYKPDSIFLDSEINKEMTGSSGTNAELAISFYHSRYDDQNNLKIDKRDQTIPKFSRNAGAVLLCHKKDGNKYIIHGKKDEEYNCISHRILSSSVNYKRSSHGHSERKLMRNVLSDLMSADEDVKEEMKFNKNENEDLKKLIDNASQYKEYLEGKGIIIKMWSERNACSKNYYDGGNCRDFMVNISPEGSHFGYFVENDDKLTKEEIIEKVKEASEELKNAYNEYQRKITMEGARNKKVTLITEKSVVGGTTGGTDAAVGTGVIDRADAKDGNDAAVSTVVIDGADATNGYDAAVSTIVIDGTEGTAGNYGPVGTVVIDGADATNGNDAAVGTVVIDVNEGTAGNDAAVDIVVTDGADSTEGTDASVGTIVKDGADAANETDAAVGMDVIDKVNVTVVTGASVGAGVIVRADVTEETL